MTPKRIQLRRTKGWRMPPNAVKVARPTIFGNPFCSGDRWLDCYFHRLYLAENWHELKQEQLGYWTIKTLQLRRQQLIAAMPRLFGKNVACWCRLSDECHGDDLLALAAKMTPAEPGGGSHE